MSDDLSQALTLYLGWETASTPVQDVEAIHEKFGDPRASQLETEVRSLIAEMGRIPVDWPTETLDSAGRIVRSEMQLRHPKLSSSALDALTWKFTWNWR